MGDAVKDTDEYKDVEWYLLQQCIGMVLTRIEERAAHGFKCMLDGRQTLLFPRIGSMTLDTPERVKYFGQRNVRSCGYCRLRNGRSCTRKASRQDGDLINLLFGWANREVHTRARISQRAKARAKLKRHGWNYKRQCQLPKYAKKCLVEVFQRPFAGLLDYERMHPFFIAFTSYMLELFAELVPKQKYAQVHESVMKCQQFRDPVTGRSHPRLPSVLKMTHMTAERRVRAIFYWAHVLGTNADVIEPASMRVHAQVAVSSLQLLLIAVRGHRAYTRPELHTIFVEVGTQFFSSLEALAQQVDASRMQRGQEAHNMNPDRNRPPVPFKRQRR